MLQKLGLVPFFLNDLKQIKNFIFAPFSHVISRPPNKIMIGAIESYWLSNWRWRNGVTCLRELRTRLLSGQTIRILLYLQTAKCLNSRQARWSLFLVVLNLPLLTGLAISSPISSSMPCLYSSSQPNLLLLTLFLPASRVVAMLTWEIEMLWGT